MKVTCTCTDGTKIELAEEFIAVTQYPPLCPMIDLPRDGSWVVLVSDWLGVSDVSIVRLTPSFDGDCTIFSDSYGNEYDDDSIARCIGWLPVFWSKPCLLDT